MEQGGLAQFSGAVGFTLSVNQKRKFDSRFLPEKPGVGHVTQADGCQPRSFVAKSLLMLAQLRDVFSTKNSAVMTEKDQDSRALRPRRGQPSPKRVPLATVEQVLGLYREQYFDLNVSHFHEKLSQQHQIGLSYTWVKKALQGAGLVAREGKRGVYRKQRERRPLPGMLLHIDGSEHRWFQDERWYDLIVILDDANSEIYYAQLVAEESTMTVLAGLKEVIERKRLVLRAVQRPGQPFL